MKFNHTTVEFGRVKVYSYPLQGLEALSEPPISVPAALAGTDQSGGGRAREQPIGTGGQARSRVVASVPGSGPVIGRGQPTRGRISQPIG